MGPSIRIRRGVGVRQVTGLLRAWSDGDDAALEQLVPLVEAELRRLARTYMRRERHGHTLQTTALVNEAFMRLVDAKEIRWTDRGHFLGPESPGLDRRGRRAAMAARRT